jgi:hypothetical protein
LALSLDGESHAQFFGPSEMKRAIKHLTKQLLSWGYAIQRRGSVQKKVILLGHMRCGSSLMVHILTSNPEIAGYGETHLDYRSIADLEKLPTNIYLTLRRIQPSRLVLDKILHDEYIQSDDILLDENCTYPIMAREAISSVSSMITSIPDRFKKANPHGEDILMVAADYYRRRLDTLCHYAETLIRRGKCWYLTYDDLLERSARAFNMLEHCLELRTPLTERYAIGPTTGIHGYGDPSDNIKRGYIDRSIVRVPVAMPQKMSEMLVEHYRSFDTFMRSICCTVDSSFVHSLTQTDNQRTP